MITITYHLWPKNHYFSQCMNQQCCCLVSEAWPFRRFFEVGYCFWSRCFSAPRKRPRWWWRPGQARTGWDRTEGKHFRCVVKFCCVSRNQLKRYKTIYKIKKSGTFWLSSGGLVVWLFARCLLAPSMFGVVSFIFLGWRLGECKCQGAVGLVIWPFCHFGSGQLVCRHHLLYDLMYVAVRPVVTTPVILTRPIALRHLNGNESVFAQRWSTHNWYTERKTTQQVNLNQ